MTCADMPAGAEMDRLVATLVMGWSRDPGHVSTMYPAQWLGENTCMPVWEWQPSTHIPHAWKAVERLCDQYHSRFEVRRDGLSNYAAIFDGLAGTGDTAPLAICRAALRAVASTETASQ